MHPSPHSPAPDATAWYLVHTKPRLEDTALLNLERQGYTCYLPRLQVEKIRRGKAVVVSEALFPRYLFVRLDASGQGQSWAPIRSTLGVSALVRFGSHPARVDEALVDLLRSREQTLAQVTLFTPGDAVRITDGPFAGIEAIYQAPDAERRSLVLLEILSKIVVMRVETGMLRRVG